MAMQADVSERGVHATPACLVLAPGDAQLATALRSAPARHPGRDVMVLDPRASLPFACEERLRKAAYGAPAVAAAVPMCDVSPLYSLVDPEGKASAADAELIDRSAYCMSLRSFYEVPRIHPVCAYLRADALAVVADALPAHGTAQALLDAFVLQCAIRGRVSVLCDYVYVAFSGEAPAEWGTLARVEEQAFVSHHPLGALRRAIAEGLARGLPPVSIPGLDEKPVQLHVMHFWGGGIDRWVRDYGRADANRSNLILATYRIGENGGQRVVLYSDAGSVVPVRTWDIATPIRSSVVANLEYRRIVEQVVEEYGVEAIFVSSLIGHSFDALTLPVKTILVCHDFYPVCETINPQLRGAPAPDFARVFGDRTPAEWKALRSRYVDHVLARGIELAVPTASVATTLVELEPRLAAATFHVVPHGIDMEAEKLPYPGREAGERLRIAVLGRLPTTKGLEILRAAREGIDANAEITLVGCGVPGVELASAAGWRSIEQYDLADLPRLLREIAPHAIVFASVVPETFSYTLSEAFALGIPPVATRLGSFAERIAEGENGFLFEPDADSLVAILARLRASPELLRGVATRLAGLPAPRTTAQMVGDYSALVPLAPRPIARFGVGVGRETALTEPYRHLNEAYAALSDSYRHLNEAFGETRAASEKTRAAYEHVREEYDRVAAILGEGLASLEALDLGRRWWHGRKAADIVAQLRARMSSRKKEK